MDRLEFYVGTAPNSIVFRLHPESEPVSSDDTTTSEEDDVESDSSDSVYWQINLDSDPLSAAVEYFDDDFDSAKKGPRLVMTSTALSEHLRLMTGRLQVASEEIDAKHNEEIDKLDAALCIRNAQQISSDTKLAACEKTIEDQCLTIASLTQQLKNHTIQTGQRDRELVRKIAATATTGLANATKVTSGSVKGE